MKSVIKYQKTSAHTRYKGSLGEHLPGVTTVLGVMDKPALIAWANNLGLQGIDYRKARDQAADIGTIAHFMCECHLKDVIPDLSEFSTADINKAENAFIKFLSWWDNSGFKMIESEVQLGSSNLRYAGTVDCIARDKDGKLILIDLKTSKAIYDEYWSQVSAYERLYDVNRLEKISRKFIVRIGKEELGDFEVIEREDLSKHFNVFNACLMLYYAKKALK